MISPQPGDTVVVWFSCGAASAVAAKETIRLWGDTCNIRVVNNPVAEEDPDNQRFLCDIAEWLGVEVESATNVHYPDASAVSVWEKRKFMSAPHGAPCTVQLKKEARAQWEARNHADWHVLGFTSDEAKRLRDFRMTERENTLGPLVGQGITKQDCFDILTDAGINPPAIYRRGYPNANCIGCVKATSPTYWNLVREQDPDVFDARAKQSRRLGARLVRHKGERIFLDELPPDAKGRPLKDYHIECGIFCEEKLPEHETEATEMTEPAHYRRGPSAAGRWLICTDSPEAQAPYPDETTDPADEGTAAHYVLEHALKEGVSAESAADTLGNVVSAGTDSGCIKDWPITGEMTEAVQVHVDAVEKHSKKRGTKLFVEERVFVGKHFGLTDTVGGTADTIMWLPKSKTLCVYDFKYGKGHVVEVTGGAGKIYEHDPTNDTWSEVPGPNWGINPQIGLYAIAALSELKRLLGKDVQVKWIELAIIQPRAYHKKGPVRTKKISPLQLMALEADLIQAVNGPRVRVPGDHCHFCRAKPDCGPYHAVRGHVATGGFEAEPPVHDADNGGVDPTKPAWVGVDHGDGADATAYALAVPENHALVPGEPALQSVPELLARPVKGLSLNDLAKARTLTRVIKAWAKEVEEEVRTRWLNNLPVPGSKLVKGPGSRAYGGTPEELEAAATRTAHDLGLENAELYEPAELKSPAKLEKQLGKTKFKASPLASLVTKTEGGPVVADADSDKPAYVKDNGFEAEAPEEKPEEKPIESPLL